MNLSETGSEARNRFETQLGELGVPAKFVDEIIGHHTLVNYNKGSMIFLQGSPADLLFWVFTGLVKVYCPRSDETRIMVKLAGPGDLIGHVDYIDSRGRRAQVFEVEALTKCSVALFTRDHVIKLLQSLDHAGLLQMIERLNTLWSSMAQWFGAFLGMPFRERLEVVLHELGSKFGVRDKRGILLMPELSHADLADMTDEGHLLRQGKQFVLLEPFAGGEFDSANQLEERRSSYPESSLPLGHSMFKRSVEEKNGRLPVSPVVPAVSDGRRNGLRI